MEGFSQDTCHAYVAGYSTSYGYVPSLSAASAFVAFFALSMLLHVGQMIWFRTWWCAVFSIGCLVELLGWAARVWSAKCPYAQTPYMMQITTLIIAPTFFTAGIYVILARLVAIFGPGSSMMPPKLYVWIFCICDVIALVVQGAGGGMASSGGSGGGDNSSNNSEMLKARTLFARATESSSSSSSSSQSTGTHIMIGGIIFQLVSITLFVALAGDFALRISKQKPGTIHRNQPLILLGGATVFSLLLIYIRSVYRTIELIHGWTSSTMRNEKLHIGLDGAMMVPAVMIYNLLHPAHLLPKVQMRSTYFKPEAYQMEDNLVGNSFQAHDLAKSDNERLIKRN